MNIFSTGYHSARYMSHDSGCGGCGCMIALVLLSVLIALIVML